MVIFEGYLDVKMPPGTPGRKLCKAWQRQWVTATILDVRGEPTLILNLYDSLSAQPREIKTKRYGVRLFRCRSRTRPFRTWGLCDGSETLLYLAADTEFQTQCWMSAIRDGLWPPSSRSDEIVSIVDDEESFKEGLLGVYGYLRKIDSCISITHPYSGSNLFSCPVARIKQTRMVRTENQEPEAGIFAIKLRESESGTTRSLSFYSFAVKEVVSWLNEETDRILNNAVNYTCKQAYVFHSAVDLLSSPCDISDAKTENHSIFPTEDKHQYAVVNKLTEKRSSKGSKFELDLLANANAAFCYNTDLNNSVKLEHLQLSADVLDSSISSVFNLRYSSSISSTSSEEETFPTPWLDENNPHIYENISLADRRFSETSHIYAEMVFQERRQSAGAQTIYESIDEEDYIPPLPSTKVNSVVNECELSTQRLEKLSKSIAETLTEIKIPNLSTLVMQREPSMENTRDLEQTDSLDENESLEMIQSDNKEDTIVNPNLQLLIPFDKFINLANHSKGDNTSSEHYGFSNTESRQTCLTHLIQSLRTDDICSCSTNIHPTLTQSKSLGLDVEKRTFSYNKISENPISFKSTDGQFLEAEYMDMSKQIYVSNISKVC